MLRRREVKKLCLSCGYKPVRHTPDDEDDCHDRFSGLCLSLHDDRNEVWYICESCFSVHLECDECNQYCNVMAIPAGCRKHEGRFLRKFFDRKAETDEKTYESLKEWQAAWYYFYAGDLGLKFLQTYVFNNPTGCDGGVPHFWVCQNQDCGRKDELREFNDK